MNGDESSSNRGQPDLGYTVPPAVLFQIIGDEAVLLDLDSGVYYGLDPVGARAWSLLVERGRLSDVYAAMLEEFEVDADTLRHDLDVLITELESRKLIVRR